MIHTEGYSILNKHIEIGKTILVYEQIEAKVPQNYSENNVKLRIVFKAKSTHLSEHVVVDKDNYKILKGEKPFGIDQNRFMVSTRACRKPREGEFI